MENGFDRVEMETKFESLCTHLQSLMDAQKEFDTKNEILMKAGHAKKVAKTVEAAKPMQEEYKQLQARCEEARDAGNQELQLYYGNMVNFRKGPFERSIQGIEAALKAGGFADLDEAISSLIEEAEYEQLRESLIDYREDYQNTLTECQRLDTLLYGKDEEPEEEEGE